MIISEQELRQFYYLRPFGQNGERYDYDLHNKLVYPFVSGLGLQQKHRKSGHQELISE